MNTYKLILGIAFLAFSSVHAEELGMDTPIVTSSALPCTGKPIGSLCMIKKFSAGRVTKIKGKCIAGVCQPISFAVTIKNGTSPQAPWHIICVVPETKKRVFVEAGETEWLNVGQGNEVVCTPCSSFGRCSSQQELRIIPAAARGFEWDGSKWIDFKPKVITWR